MNDDSACKLIKEPLKKQNNDVCVTVIVPIFNMEGSLEKCVRSIQAQTFELYEIILIDDGSEDNSYKIAQKLAEEDSKIKVIHKKNEGVSVARNVGMRVASGEWIMFIDPDDQMEPTLIDELLLYTNEEVDIVACCCNVFFDDTKLVDYFFSENRIFSNEEDKKDLFKQLMKLSYGQPGKAFTAIGVPWGKLYRKKFLEEKHLNFNLRLKRYQDNIFNMHAFFYARSIVYINKPLYNYHTERITKYDNSIYKPGMSEYIGALCEVRYESLKKWGLLEDDEIKEFYQREMMYHLLKILNEDIFSPGHKIFFKERIEKMRGLCEKKCFVYLIQDAPKDISRRMRMRLYLMKKERYVLLGMWLSYSRLKKIIKLMITVRRDG